MKKGRLVIRSILSVLFLSFAILYIGRGRVEAASGICGSVYSDDYGYRTLDSNEQKAYMKLLAQVQAFHTANSNAEETIYTYSGTTYSIPAVDIAAYELSFQSVYKIMYALKADNPEYFWIQNFSYSFIPPNNYIQTIKVTVVPEYAAGAARSKARKAVQKGLLEYTRAIDALKAKKASEITMELAIHDRIIKNTAYAYDSDGTGADEEWAHSIVGVFTKGEAVCEGYAKAFQILANYAGLTSLYVTGDSGGGHAWNYVRIAGKWYALDVTWDDQPRLTGGINYDYFNFNNSFFTGYASAMEPHTVDTAGEYGVYPVPVLTTDKTYWYYTYYGLYVTSDEVASNTAFTKCLVRAVQAGERRGDYYVRLKAATPSVFAKIRTMYQAVRYEAVAQASTATARYTLGNTVNYISGCNQFIFQTFKTKITGTKITAAKCQTISNRAYTGKSQKPAVRITYKGKTLKKGRDYTVSYSNSKNIGTATIVVRGKGNFSGSRRLTFKIVPKRVTKLKITSKRKSKITISYKKVAKATGYRILYSTKKGKGYKPLRNVKGTSYVKSKLKRGKVLYIKVAAYRKIKGKVYCGSYSKPVRVKVR